MEKEAATVAATGDVVAMETTTIMVTNDDDDDNGATIVAVAASDDTATTGTRTRKRKSTVRGEDLATTQSKNEPKTKKARDSNMTTVDTESEFAMAWICAACKEAECMLQPDATELMVCDGVCRRLFHYPCAGLHRLPVDDEPFVCADCEQHHHVCSICLEYGTDHVDVFPCQHSSCGLFFHASCLAMQGIAVVQVPSAGASTVPETTDGNAKEQSTVLNFKCPAHQCWTCSQEDEKRNEEATPTIVEDKPKRGRKPKKKKKKQSVFQCKSEYLSRCLECARAYHVTCIPPNARFHELATLCHEHTPIAKLPELNESESLQMQLEQKAESKTSGTTHVVRRKKQRRVAKHEGTNTFFLGLEGDTISKRQQELRTALHAATSDTTPKDNNDYPFCLPVELRDEVHAKPPRYRHVTNLQYGSQPHKKPPRIAPEQGACDCLTVCDDNCINRTLYTECFGNGKQESSNCNVGVKCGNRQFGQRLFANCKPQREKGRGWGLVPVDPVYQGDLVVEYVGEVIDEPTKDARLEAWSEEHPNDPNFYIMELQPGWFIDARNVANLSRFINHACDPNCRLTQINCKGKMRCGIFALRDIAPGEFLSYDYHFDTRHGDKFICCCGSANCRGTMKGGVSEETAEVSTKTQKETWDDAKAAYERDRKFVEEFEQRQANEMSLVSEFVPAADRGSMHEYVATGPQRKFRDKARRFSLFLWRNAMQGSNLSRRIDRVVAQQTTVRKQQVKPTEER